MASGISMGARREVLAAVARRYRAAGRVEKRRRILDELTATTAWHRKATAPAGMNPTSTGGSQIQSDGVRKANSMKSGDE
jgi:hypothetical protein